jgi:hypothetical protein
VPTGINSLADALVSASVVLTAAIFGAGAASAGPSQQQDQFVALLEQDGIPALDNVPALVARAHRMENPAYHQESAKVHRTAIRFIAVSAEVYCSSHLSDPYVSDDVGFSIHDPATRPLAPYPVLSGHSDYSVQRNSIR